MNNITNEQLDGLIKSAVNSSGPLPPDEKFSQIISALRELRDLRTAMLQGAEPVSNRDELTDGWVACSERMPMDGFDVLCASEFDGPGYWRRKVGYWHRGKWVVYGASWTPTHWMPLPSPPFK
ncbi:DUF551 domain-containing protein [Enterobacter hormaechei]|uniref:DUF551 domain-containing protein n=1 Tax=Enterobacter hormaechei TaxID=158836 RepID=UPI0034D34E03